QDGAASPWVVLLSCDLPLAEAGVRRLREAVAGDPGAGGADDCGDGPGADAGSVDGYLLVDDEGRQQWLFGIYRADRLAAAVRRHADPAGMSMRRLLAGLTLVSVAGSGDVSADLDTWDDHAAWTARLET
uniref:molybdenum cofactor guanylyltransferase n=1 Tax=Cumulibacter manganitolerans TaxID=1884992 RepID=UPI001E552F3C